MGQSTAPSFEVATIRPSPPDQTIDQQMAQGRLHLGVSITQSRVDIGFFTLADMIPIAYRVKPSQIAGPDWMKKDRWDIVATFPASTSTPIQLGRFQVQTVASHQNRSAEAHKQASR